MKQGHYVSYVSESGTWYRMDDHEVYHKTKQTYYCVCETTQGSPPPPSCIESQQLTSDYVSVYSDSIMWV